MSRDYRKELEAATASIVDVKHPKKIVVAGAGTGKTFTFAKLLDKLPVSPKERRLVVTFLSGLKRDLEGELGEKAWVQTFHGYCYTLMKQMSDIRDAAGFSSAVRYVPRIGQLIKSDWALSKGDPPPTFLPSLRNLVSDEASDFFLARGKYYDAIGYDDSTVHIHRAFNGDKSLIPNHDLVIVDEVQDLNKAEVSIIDFLASRSDVVVAGDDDQALYGNLRGASEDYIREIYERADYLQRNLPFCMRCPSVVVNATDDIIEEAHKLGLLGARIPKPYEPFPRPVDEQCPTIKVVQTSVQTPKANLFGKYIHDRLSNIPADEIKESHEKGFPTALIIGTKPYANQVKTFLEEQGWEVETKAVPKEKMEDPFTRENGLDVLMEDEQSNLGWRIVLEADAPTDWKSWVSEAVNSGRPLIDILDVDFRNATLAEVRERELEEEAAAVTSEMSSDKPTIRLTSFEGAKGMSAQHVFILGLEDGKFPANRNAIRSVDVRRMIVALTRTRKQCYLLMSRMSFTGGRRRVIRPSIFVDWIQIGRRNTKSITASSFEK